MAKALWNDVLSIMHALTRVTRFVSMAHALIIIPLAFLCLDIPKLDQDRAFGFDIRVGQLCAIACGYEC